MVSSLQFLFSFHSAVKPTYFSTEMVRKPQSRLEKPFFKERTKSHPPTVVSEVAATSSGDAVKTCGTILEDFHSTSSHSIFHSICYLPDFVCRSC
jgi:hypothetical protein